MRERECGSDHLTCSPLFAGLARVLDHVFCNLVFGNMVCGLPTSAVGDWGGPLWKEVGFWLLFAAGLLTQGGQGANLVWIG